MNVDQRTIDAATAAVAAASRLTSAAQGRLLDGETLTKTDDSPVTVADFGAQAVVCSVLADSLGDVIVVGEEDPDDLAADRPGLLEGSRALVADALGRDVTVDQLLQWVGLGTGTTDGAAYWTLDPIDGTKGFLRGDQYAIALGLIVDGEVVLGVLGCPNYPVGDGDQGMMLVAAHGETTEVIGERRRRISVADPASISASRFCESVESAHSDHDQSVAIAERLGIRSEPYRIDSQCKYGAIARSDAHIYLRLPTRADYEEKIWDHAAGLAAVEFAGGRVTDVEGRPLDFSIGPRLSANRGVVATSGRHHDEVIAAVRHVLG